MGTTKRDLSRRIAQRSGLTQSTVRHLVQAVFDEIAEELAAGHRLEFRNFGIFEVNESTPPSHDDDARPRTVRFKPGRQLRSRMAGDHRRANASPAGAGETESS